MIRHLASVAAGYLAVFGVSLGLFSDVLLRGEGVWGLIRPLGDFVDHGGNLEE